MILSEIDRQLIEATQDGLPVTRKPYSVIADKLNIAESEVIRRLNSMYEQNVIRRVAATPNHYRLGFNANGMSVWDIDDDQVPDAGLKVAAFSFVSHCYQRPRRLPDWPYNLFAMVHGKTRPEVEEKVVQIANALGDSCKSHDVLYSKRILKKTGMRLRPRTENGKL